MLSLGIGADSCHEMPSFVCEPIAGARCPEGIVHRAPLHKRSVPFPEFLKEPQGQRTTGAARSVFIGTARECICCLYSSAPIGPKASACHRSKDPFRLHRVEMQRTFPPGLQPTSLQNRCCFHPANSTIIAFRQDHTRRPRRPSSCRTRWNWLDENN